MILAAARVACPGAPLSARVARRPGYNPYARRDWLRISHRLATGMTAQEVARAEAVDAAEIEGLLAQPDFSGLVDAARALAARPAAEQTARLVTLARFALEMALADGDMRVAAFILREADRGRDPAAAVAKGVLAASRRGKPGGNASPAQPSGPALTSARPRARAEDADARWFRQGALAVRGAVVAEHAIRHAAAGLTAAGGTPTEAAARQALALKAVAGSSPSSARPVAALARELAGGAAPVSLNVGQAPTAPCRPPIAGLPRRPRAP